MNENQDGPPVTEWLRQWQDSEDQESATNLYNYYQQNALRLAMSRMSPKLQKYKRPESVAHSALAKALASISKSDKDAQSREEFEKLLFRIVQRRAADADRRRKAQKRGSEKQSQADPEIGATSAEGDPDEKLAIDELVDATIQSLMSEPDPVRRDAVLLSILGGYSAERIRTLLEPLCGENVPSRSTITVWVRNARKKLNAAVSGDDEELP